MNEGFEGVMAKYNIFFKSRRDERRVQKGRQKRGAEGRRQKAEGRRESRFGSGNFEKINEEK